MDCQPSFKRRVVACERDARGDGQGPRSGDLRAGGAPWRRAVTFAVSGTSPLRGDGAGARARPRVLDAVFMSALAASARPACPGSQARPQANKDKVLIELSAETVRDLPLARGTRCSTTARVAVDSGARIADQPRAPSTSMSVTSCDAARFYHRQK